MLHCMLLDQACLYSVPGHTCGGGSSLRQLSTLCGHQLALAQQELNVHYNVQHYKLCNEGGYIAVQSSKACVEQAKSFDVSLEYCQHGFAA